MPQRTAKSQTMKKRRLRRAKTSRKLLSLNSSDAAATTTSFDLFTSAAVDTIYHRGDEPKAELMEIEITISHTNLPGDETLFRTSTPLETEPVTNFSLCISPIKMSSMKKSNARAKGRDYGRNVKILPSELVKRAIELCLTASENSGIYIVFFLLNFIVLCDFLDS